MSVTATNSKFLPIPPPKPKNYRLQYPNGQIVKVGQFLCNTPGGGQLPAAPGDSDTDSGICADSDNQLSPRHITVGAAGYLEDNAPRRIEIPVYREHLTPDSARRLWVNSPNSSVSTCQRRLPQSLQTSYTNQSSRTGKQFRVRFADQISSSNSSSLPEWNNGHMPSGANYSGYLADRSTTAGSKTESATDNSSNPTAKQLYGQTNTSSVHPSTATNNDSRHQQVFDRYTMDDSGSVMPRAPTSYGTTITRLRRCDQFSNEPHHRFHGRSASLPRRMHQSEYLEGRRGSADCCYSTDRSFAERNATFSPADAHLMRSTDNLHAANIGNRTNLSNGRRLPDLPSESVTYETNVRQPAFSRQRRMRRTAISARSQSVGRSPAVVDSGMTNNYLSARYRPSVRAQLIALDHRGLRTVLIEKLEPGPFGFYIATGVLNQRRGIFISRVSLSSLAPVISVGDEIIYVEDELVKGQDLEYVQTLIAGKTIVKIALLPTIAPDLY